MGVKICCQDLKTHICINIYDGQLREPDRKSFFKVKFGLASLEPLLDFLENASLYCSFNTCRSSNSD